MKRFYAGEDHGNYADYYPFNRFLPQVGECFVLVEWQPIRHSGHRDGSWVYGKLGEYPVFECEAVRGSNVDARRVDDRVYTGNEHEHYTFNTNVIKLAPYGRVLYTAERLRNENSALLTSVDSLRRENERLRSEAGQKDSKVRRLESLIEAYRDQRQIILRTLGY